MRSTVLNSGMDGSRGYMRMTKRCSTGERNELSLIYLNVEKYEIILSEEIMEKMYII